jgi:hypothetical protein
MIKDLGVFQLSWRAGLTRPMINQRATKQRRINPAYGRYTIVACRTSPVHRALRVLLLVEQRPFLE